MSVHRVNVSYEVLRGGHFSYATVLRHWHLPTIFRSGRPRWLFNLRLDIVFVVPLFPQNSHVTPRLPRFRLVRIGKFPLSAILNLLRLRLIIGIGVVSFSCPLCYCRLIFNDIGRWLSFEGGC